MVTLERMQMDMREFVVRGGSRTAATSKMERFVIIVNGWKPLTITTKRSILDVAAVLEPLLMVVEDLEDVIWRVREFLNLLSPTT